MTSLRKLPVAKLREKYDLNVMIETGTEGGDGVEVGLSVGFERVLSCEIDENCFNVANRIFGDNEQVTLLLCSSEVALPIFLKDQEEHRILFWLDAHLQANAKTKTADEVAILDKELEIITKHRDISNDVVLIDDMVLYEKSFRHPEFDIKRYVSDPENLIDLKGILSFFPKHERTMYTDWDKVLALTPVGIDW